MKEPILKCENLNKDFGKKQILKDVSLEVYEGDILGFIGPNGAGKTTTIKLILGLQNITRGKVLINGYDIEKQFSKAIENVGAIVENPDLYMYLSGYENLKLAANLYKEIDKKRINEVLKLVGLEKRANEKVSKYSLGMRQRLGIANALMGNPKLLILDEPINGLDPMGIVEIRELLKKINKEKDMTILISSHILSELSELATTYGIISNGKLIEEITAKQLSEKCRQYIDLKVDDTARAVILLERELGISDYEVLEDSNIKVFSNLDNVGEVNSLLSRSGIIVESISVKGENLEEYFMNKVGGVLNA